MFQGLWTAGRTCGKGKLRGYFGIFEHFPPSFTIVSWCIKGIFHSLLSSFLGQHDYAIQRCSSSWSCDNGCGSVPIATLSPAPKRQALGLGHVYWRSSRKPMKCFPEGLRLKVGQRFPIWATYPSRAPSSLTVKAAMGLGQIRNERIRGLEEREEEYGMVSFNHINNQIIN